MSESTVAQCRVGQFPYHGNLEGGHNFSAFHAKNCGAKHLVGLSVDDGLHEAARFVDFKSTGYMRHWQFRDADVTALGARFRLGQADSAQLRIDKDGIRNLACLLYT